MKINLQFFGGNGSDGPSLGKGKDSSIDILDRQDMLSYMKNNSTTQEFGDMTMAGVRQIYDDFPGMNVEEIQAVKLGGYDNNHTLGFYDGSNVAINRNFAEPAKMNLAYDIAIKQGYHPARGKMSGTEAVALHEMGHALTDHVGKKMGSKDIDASAKAICDKAYQNTGGKGSAKVKWAKNISGYAGESYAECVAEAVADYYCNGNKAHANSKAIMAVINSYK